MPFRGELYLPPDFTPRNTDHGRFVKGHEPHNKGKKWGEYMSKRGMKRASKGWENLKNHRPTKRPDTSGRCRKPLIAVMDDGSWLYFSHSTAAKEWLGNGNRENILRCCRFNELHHASQKTGEVNTDHKYMGIRFYYESDDTWTTKIKKE